MQEKVLFPDMLLRFMLFQEVLNQYQEENRYHLDDFSISLVVVDHYNQEILSPIALNDETHYPIDKLHRFLEFPPADKESETGDDLNHKKSSVPVELPQRDVRWRLS